MSKNIAEIFNLQGLKVSNVSVSDQEIIIRAELRKEYVKCPHCNRRSYTCYEKGKLRRIKHQYWGRKIVILEGSHVRWWCKKCNRAFIEKWPQVQKWSRKTEEAKTQILTLLKNKSFRQLNEENRVTDREARYILQKVDTSTNWDEERTQRKISIGIDEHSFRGRDLVITITNLSKKRLKGILPDDRQKTLKDYLRSIPKQVVPRICEVCIDMKELFAKAIEQELPNSNIVVDHFHIIKDANHRLEEARSIEKEVQKTKSIGKRWWFLMGRERLDDKHKFLLDKILERYPNLREFYYFKEQLRDFYKSKNKEVAAVFLSRIILNMESSDDAAIYQWSKTLKHWRNYILNYFDRKTTNAYTEGSHTKIKMIKRLSYGFKNINIYIRKMMIAFIPFAFLAGINYPTIC